MIFEDDEPIVTVKRNGAKPAKAEVDYLREIAKQLSALANRPPPKPEKVDPPKITVNTPEPSEPIRKWKFDLSRNADGCLKQIIATAID
jgi:hypothetical protein